MVEVNAKARVEALRVSLAVLAVLAMSATFLTRLLPAEPATDEPEGEPQPSVGREPA